ncbi:cation-translocating P-type ATPase [Aspergillus stella-maris]|uniref:cation-translocating P-type ATPase n=1 Tax=Aspergillus stella-maris TaxID=1810926 RepID=UPI003CCC9601
MILLTASATVNLALGIYQSVTAEPGEPSVEWVEGVSIIVAVIVIVLETAINDYQKDRKFQLLNKVKEEAQQISIYGILVGDIVHIETGDVIPADGILAQGFSVQCDKSSATGEWELIEKRAAVGEHTVVYDPFMLSGSKVSNGVGRFLITSVGENTSYGRIIMSLWGDVEEMALQQKLAVLAQYIIIVGLIVGGIFFLIILIRYLGEEFLNVLILSITVAVIAVPEGLPLAVTMALAFATTRMLKDKNLVRLLWSCEVMGNATTICSDEAGTVTQNKMTVVGGRVGTAPGFGDVRPAPGTEIEAKSLYKGMISWPAAVKDILKDSIVLNSTGIEKSTEGGVQLTGSSTEVALVECVQSNLHLDGVAAHRETAEIVEVFPFSSKTKSMATVVRLPSGTYRLFVKGAPEIVSQFCRDTLRQVSSQFLRCIALAYRDFDMWPPQATKGIALDNALRDMVLLGIFGLRDTLRPEVLQAVLDCQTAGVTVRMATGDTFLTAKSIAFECGIYSAGGIAMDSSVFRRLTSQQWDIVLPRPQILSRSSPEDKLRLVKHLKSLGETVAVTGDGTNDALALKAADVGFAMGIQGTEVAKEASSIILMDDNFASIAKALLWGQNVNDAAKKFLQFQFTINVSAGILTTISAITGGTDSSVFTVVQLLWINLIMDTFAALALATDWPTRSLINRKPEPRGASILTFAMWKMVAGQSIYQLIVIFVLHYAGARIFGYSSERHLAELQTMTFNIYVWMQFCNIINCRTVNNTHNLLEGLTKNYAFFLVQSVILTGQIIIIFKGGQTLGVLRYLKKGAGRTGDSEKITGLEVHLDTRKDDMVIASKADVC